MDETNKTTPTPIVQEPPTPPAKAPESLTQMRKYRRNGVIWLLVPFILLTATLISYAVAQFIVATAFLNQPAPTQGLSGFGLEYAANIGLGAATPADSAAGFINVILGFVGVLSVIFIPVGIILAVLYFSKARKVSLINFDARSGKGPASEIPEEIKGWSWGAAGLNWIWGAYHGVWLSLLILISPLNLIWWIVLGLKGREWAWRNTQWQSVSEFLAVQKKWDLWGAIFFFLPMVLGLILILTLIFS